MLFPLSWLKEFVDIEVPIAELVHRLTLAGLEVEEVRFVGLPLPAEKIEGHTSQRRRLETNVTGFAWDREKIVVGAIQEVMPHPNADRLVLCRLDDGQQEHVVLTGAPNLFEFTGKGPLDEPLKVAYAREGAQIYDGHQPGQELMTLKRAKIRGVESYSMACSEKELGISDEHEGIIILDEDAPVGMPLADYMGDVVLDIAITPNIARNANMLGVAREIAALTGVELREPSLEVAWSGPPIEGRVNIEIQHPELNPRFVLGLLEGVTIGPSPFWVQRRLRLAGMRPINNIVDTTNYVMLEVGQPLHAFDYDVLVARAGGEVPTIITRLPEPGERLTTLDEVDRSLDDFTVLVADTSGALSLAGVMGGAESEVSEGTVNVLLEGAAWNYINIRRTVSAQKLSSDAAYRFERGVHPAMAERGVRGCLAIMARLAGGKVAEGLVDAYPLPPEDPTVEVKPVDVERLLGVHLGVEEIAEILRRLTFEVEVKDGVVRATAPDYRLDIGLGVIGVADVIEEIARVYGYDRIPETQIADTIPPQYGNPNLEREERVRDLLVYLGLQEVVTYRITSPEREKRIHPPEAEPEDQPYIQIANPIASDRIVMRRSLLASLLEIVERNARIRERISIFEIGPVYLVTEEDGLPDEPRWLAIVLTGQRSAPTWREVDLTPIDFYDLKGLMDELFAGLQIENIRYQPKEHPSFHPGKSAEILFQDHAIGIMGELHPSVRENYDLPEAAIVAGEFDLEMILDAISEGYTVHPVPVFPPVLEDLAIVVDEGISAEEVEAQIREAAGSLLIGLRLFDLYRGEQIAEGKKSLAYSLTYQASDRTLTDEEVAKIRAKVIARLGSALGAKLRD